MINKTIISEDLLIVTIQSYIINTSLCLAKHLKAFSVCNTFSFATPVEVWLYLEQELYKIMVAHS